MRRQISKSEVIVAKNLKSLRGDLSQVEFSKKLGIAQSTLNRIENKEASVTVYLLDKIATKLKKDITELFREPRSDKK